MSLPVSTLILYKNTDIEIDRNFMIDSIADYLATQTKETISNFQYIKHQLLLNIKIDKAQANLEYLSANNYNYCSIQNTDGKVVYYYITGKEWKGQSTILLHLAMDTINTFKLGTDYSLSNKTLVMREHKDRFKKISVSSIDKLDRAEDDSMDTQEQFSFTFYTPHKVDSIEFGGTISVDYPDGIVRGVEVSITSWNQVDNQVNVLYSVGLNSASDLGAKLNRQFYFVVSFLDEYVRDVDKFPEGINPVLYKKDLKELHDADEDSNWYVIYANSNNVVDDPSSATEQLAVNPVRILLCKDIPVKKVASTITSVRIDCTSIPKISGADEYVLFRYVDSQANSTITIGSDTYTLVADGSQDRATKKCLAIVWHREYDNDIAGDIRIYYDFYTSTQIYHDYDEISNVSFITIYDYANAFIAQSRFYSTKRVFDYDESMYIGSVSDGTTDSGHCISDVDLTEPKIIKIIALPYAPLDFLRGRNSVSALPDYLVWNSSWHMLEMATTNIFRFNAQLEFDENPLKKLVQSPSLVDATPKNSLYESKMYMSEFYYTKFVYGAYGFQFNLEYVDITEDIFQFNVKYVVSQSCQSKMMFQFVNYITTDYDTADYNNVLLVGMNNEKAIFNNSYINYLRNGLKYDQDAKAQNNNMKWLGIGLSAVGTMASFISAPFTGGLTAVAGIGLGTSTVSQIANAVHADAQAERNLQAKKTQMANQAEGVSMVEDVDILEAYSNNKAKIVEYKPSKVMQDRIFELFYYCGYATQEYKVPTFTGRRYFNFVQAQIKYASDANLPEDIKEDIKMKYEAGITCLHKVNNAWHFALSYENYETSLI